MCFVFLAYTRLNNFTNIITIYFSQTHFMTNSKCFLLPHNYEEHDCVHIFQLYLFVFLLYVRSGGTISVKHIFTLFTVVTTRLIKYAVKQ